MEFPLIDAQVVREIRQFEAVAAPIKSREKKRLKCIIL
jgi:hypothetical protein